MMTEMEGMIKTACDIVHQAEENAILLVYPTCYAGSNINTVLTMQRKIEDRMMQAKLLFQAPRNNACMQIPRCCHWGLVGRQDWGPGTAVSVSLASKTTLLDHKDVCIERNHDIM